MKRLSSACALMGLVLLPWSGAHAQVTIDVAKISCEQLILFKVSDPQNIGLWLNGYYHAKRNSTLIDTQQLKSDTQKIMDYCLHNQQETVMHAVESVLGGAK